MISSVGIQVHLSRDNREKFSHEKRSEGAMQDFPGIFPLTSLQDWMAMYSAKIFFAFEAILDCDLIFLYSSHASQNSKFSSLNSVRRKALNAARPSEGGGKTRGVDYSAMATSPWSSTPGITL